jgi:hypothetical protein
MRIRAVSSNAELAANSPAWQHVIGQRGPVVQGVYARLKQGEKLGLTSLRRRTL